MFIDVGDRTAQEVASQDGAEYPENPAQNVESKISAVGHSRRPRHGGAKRPHHGNESRDDDRLHPVLFVELVRPREVTLLEVKRISAAVERLSSFAPHEIVEL